MTTTIKISETNQSRLFKLKNCMEKEMHASVSYNDVVEILLNKLENMEAQQLVADLVSIKGILNSEDKNYYLRMREIDRRRENRFIDN